MSTVRLYWSGSTALELFSEDGHVVDVTDPLSLVRPALALTASVPAEADVQFAGGFVWEYAFSHEALHLAADGASVEVVEVDQDDLYVAGDVGVVQIHFPPPGAVSSTGGFWLYNRAREAGATRVEALASLPLLLPSARVRELFDTLLADGTPWGQAARLAAEVERA